MFLKGIFLGLAIGSVSLNALLWLVHIAIKYGYDANDLKGHAGADKKDPRGERYIRAFSSNIAMCTHFLLIILGVLEIVQFGQKETDFTKSHEYVSIPLYLTMFVSMFSAAIRLIVYYMQAGYVGQAQIEDLGEDMLWTSLVALIGSIVLFFIPITSISNAIPVLFVAGAVAFGYVVFHTLRMHTIKMNFWTTVPALGFILLVITNLVFIMMYHPHYDVLFRRLEWIPLIAIYGAAALTHLFQTLYEYAIERQHISGSKLRSTLGATGAALPESQQEGDAKYPKKKKTMIRYVSKSLFGL